MSRALVLVVVGVLVVAGGAALTVIALSRDDGPVATAPTAAAVTTAGNAPALAPAMPITPTPPTLKVPRAATAPTIDGELSDASWLAGAARTGAFKQPGATPPYSDARFMWRDDTLYIGLYAADEDIRAPLTTPDAPIWLGDHFHVEIDGRGFERSLDVSPRGVLTDGRRSLGGGGPLDFGWQSGARLAVDLDGSIDTNEGEEADEEWAIEMALPLAAIDVARGSGEGIPIEVHRCDTLRETRSCAGWRGVLTLVGP